MKFLPVLLVGAMAAVTEITRENQMKIFMSRDTVLGEWLAYFDHSDRYVNTLNKVETSVRIARVNW